MGTKDIDGEISSPSEKGFIGLNSVFRSGRDPPVSSFLGQNLDTHQDVIKTAP